MSNLPAGIRPVSSEMDYLKWLLYGDPGVGKTVLTASASNNLPTLILKSRSDNVESVKIQGYDKAKVWEMESWADMEEAETYLRYENHGFKVVSMDTYTLFSELGLENIMQDLIDQGKSHRKLYLPDKGEYGQNMNRLGKWVRDMKSLPFHFIVVAHAGVWRRDDQEEERLWPLIQGKGMPAKIAGYMPFVTYMTAGTNDEGVYVRKIYSRKEETFYAKDGWDAFPNGFMNDPTLPKILKILESKKGPVAKKVGPVTKKVATAKKSVAKKAAPTRKGN